MSNPKNLSFGNPVYCKCGNKEQEYPNLWCCDRCKIYICDDCVSHNILDDLLAIIYCDNCLKEDPKMQYIINKL